MKRIIFTNSKGDSITFGNTAPFIMLKIEGTGCPQATIQMTKAPFQDGKTYIDNNLETRQITMEIGILGRDGEDTMRLRSKVASIFNPKLGFGTLKYEYEGGVKEIKAISEQAPIYPGGKENRTTIFQRGLINLLCPNPFWTDDYEESKEIATWIGGLSFPLVLPSIFANRGPKKKNIINVGDVETPVTIIFKGPATNPKVANLSTGEFIKVNRTLISSDKLIINTAFGNKRVEIEDGAGNRTNVFNWIDLDSTFWQLQVGDNIIEYSSDNQVEPAEVYIKYRNRYVGI